jgi:hypothetical protein
LSTLGGLTVDGPPTGASIAGVLVSFGSGAAGGKQLGPPGSTVVTGSAGTTAAGATTAGAGVV